MQFKNRNLLKIYFGLVSFVSILVIAFSLSAVATNILKYILISDDEYIASRSYILDSCKYELNGGKKIERDTEEIAKCLAEKTKIILSERRYNLKNSIINALSYFIIFFVIFGIHFLQFKKLSGNQNKGDT